MIKKVFTFWSILSSLFLISGFFSVRVMAVDEWVQLSAELREVGPNKFKDTVVLSCKPGEVACEKICGNAARCEYTQPACVDCVSQTNRLLQVIFRNLNEVFVADFNRSQGESRLSEILQKSPKFVLSARSYLNVFNPKMADATQKSFDQLCPSSESIVAPSVLLLDLDQQRRLVSLSHVVCHYVDTTFAVAVGFNPNFTPSPDKSHIELDVSEILVP